jgi:recombination protein RecR
MGLYYVLRGIIEPMNNVGPEDLRIRELLARLSDGTYDLTPCDTHI